ncbi:MAG TPA: ABC transporter permease, partial [Cyanobacteria bacterium UBA11691]|nr:ABC transporter permease [Cyanobacteria bacterium UBA11691]
GLGYLVSALTVFLRDIPQSLAVITNLWFYMTPIVYPVTIIPEPWRQWVFWLNPLAAISETYRDLILVGHMQHWGEWMSALGISLVLLSGGLWVYRRLRPAFADVI